MLRLNVDRNRLRADGQDLAFVTIEARDRRGVWQPWSTARVTVQVDGAGSLAALGTGDLTTLESYTASERALYQGRAMAVIRTAERAGPIEITVSAPGMAPARAKLKATRP